MKKVKKIRRYDASGRHARARQSREEVTAIARREFLARGYADTTIGEIARQAGVSVETIYKGFGGKPGLVRAIYARGLEGRSPEALGPAPQRSNTLSADAGDPREIVRGWGALVAEVSPLASPILLLVRSAAASDRALATLLEQADARRLRRMRANARVLERRGFLRRGVTVARAADIMWTCVSPELYELLVVRRGWTAQALGDHVAETLIAALLPP